MTADQQHDKDERAPRVLEVNFGALAPDLAAQLKHCGLKAPEKAVEHWQRDIKDLARLRIRGHVADAEAHRIEGRIFKDIKKGLIL